MIQENNLMPYDQNKTKPLRATNFSVPQLTWCLRTVQAGGCLYVQIQEWRQAERERRWWVLIRERGQWSRRNLPLIWAAVAAAATPSSLSASHITSSRLNYNTTTQKTTTTWWNARQLGQLCPWCPNHHCNPHIWTTLSLHVQ